MTSLRPMPAIAAAIVALFAAARAFALEAGCDAPVGAAGASLRDYRPIFGECRNDAGATRLAIRSMSAGGAALLLTVDPETLATRLEPAQCWRCRDTSDEEQSETRYLRALRPPAAATPPALKNAGLTHGAGGGVFVTGDLCPSRRPLDRAFLERLAAEGPKTPVALAVSGFWLTRHGADFDWLMEKVRAGALDVSWVNHSYRHPYVPGLAESRNYLLRPGTDMDREILDTERLLISKGATPSIFFRFPGLVADENSLEQVRRRHLVALGADAWLALSPPLRPGAIVLVHPNGNEPAGLRLFYRLLEKGALPRPFRRIEDAPSF